MSAVVITVISIVFVMLSCVLFYFLAKSRADKGMLPQGKDWDRSRIPISLVFDYEGFRYIITRMKFVYAEALRFYNREVGAIVFNMIDDIGRGGLVTIKAGEIDALGRTDLTFDSDGKIKTAFITMDPTRISGLSDDVLIGVAAHELGHVLGLDHDEDGGSVMYHKANSLTKLKLTDKDVELLRNTYVRL